MDNLRSCKKYCAAAVGKLTAFDPKDHSVLASADGRRRPTRRRGDQLDVLVTLVEAYERALPNHRASSSSRLADSPIASFELLDTTRSRLIQR
jgi:hypothetical protein